jgi:hypothetical protein
LMILRFMRDAPMTFFAPAAHRRTPACHRAHIEAQLKSK